MSQASLKTLTESKEIRESLGQENHHEEQCNGIPEALSERSLFYCRECYQKFTFAKTLLKRKRNQADDPSKCRKHLSREHGASDSKNSRGRFPKHFMICLKERIKVKGKFQVPTKIITKFAEATLKKAAVLKNDLAMLASVTDTDLIVKEFSKHGKCYLEYTRVTREKSANTSTISEKSAIQGDFDAACEVIEKRVLEEQQCLSMESIVSVYGINEGDRQQRYRLTTRLLQKYGDDLLFISHEKHSPQLVISKICSETQTMSRVLGSSESNTIKKAAVILREAVKKTIDESEALPWPSTTESLRKDDRNAPDILKLFYENLLSPASVHHGTSLTAERLIGSFSQDIMYAVSKGEFLTLKHASVGLGLHSRTGQKLPLQVLSRLGHCMTYDQICEVETAQAELVQHLKSLSIPLPICPIDEESKVLTTFRWNNFDRNIETASGARSIHNTPGIMFQEESACTVNRNENVSIPKSKRRSVRLEDVPQSRQQLSAPKKIHLHLLTKILFRLKTMSKCIAIIY